jgi:hypothetical protein
MLNTEFTESAGHAPPTNLHEYQKKGVTEIAFRKLLILKDATSGCFGFAKAEMAAVKRKSGSKLPRIERSYLQNQLYHRFVKSQEKFLRTPAAWNREIMFYRDLYFARAMGIMACS